MSPKRIRKQKPRKGRVPMPPPTEVMGDKRTKRPADQLRRELEQAREDIDQELRSNDE